MAVSSQIYLASSRLYHQHTNPLRMSKQNHVQDQGLLRDRSPLLNRFPTGPSIHLVPQPQEWWRNFLPVPQILGEVQRYRQGSGRLKEGRGLRRLVR